MEVMYRCCCGLDIHKKLIVACMRKAREKEVREFGTTTGELRAMAQWLLEGTCEMTAMESTGVYWKPIHNVLEVLGVPCMVVNAHHIKAVPGRKTDVKDAEWIADLLRHGLLRPSYIPSRDQRELRDATRYRKSMIEERTRELNRLDKLLEGANIKISSVISGLNTITGRSLIDALVLGDVTDGNIDGLLKGSTKSKRSELLDAVDGVLSNMQRGLIRFAIAHIDDLTRRIEALDVLIAHELDAYGPAIERLCKIPGIGEVSAQAILAETGLDMGVFANDRHISAWSGLSPGNNESAGRRKKAATRRGNKTLKTTLVQCASSAVKVKGTYFKAQYERLVVRTGKKRAIVAVAHSILIAIYHMLKEDVPFKDLGEDYYTKHNTERKAAYHLRKLRELGYEADGTAQASKKTDSTLAAA
jgi:transposase